MLPKHPSQPVNLSLFVFSAVPPKFSPKGSRASSLWLQLRGKNWRTPNQACRLPGRHIACAWSLTGRRTVSAAWRALPVVPELLSYTRRQQCDISIHSTLSAQGHVKDESLATASYFTVSLSVSVIILQIAHLNLRELARNSISLLNKSFNIMLGY